MKRQGIVAVVAIVALVIAVVFLARRGSVGGEKEAGGEATGSRFYASDSLGFRLRIPDSPDWTLRTEPAGQPDGSILTAMHSNEMAIVRVFTHPAAPGETVDDVFEARKRVFAKFFGIDDLDSAIAKVMQEGHHELEGRHSRQWQASRWRSSSCGSSPSTPTAPWSASGWCGHPCPQVPSSSK
jgi:hypothetical protein